MLRVEGVVDGCATVGWRFKMGRWEWKRWMYWEEWKRTIEEGV